MPDLKYGTLLQFKDRVIDNAPRDIAETHERRIRKHGGIFFFQGRNAQGMAVVKSVASGTKLTMHMSWFEPLGEEVH